MKSKVAAAFFALCLLGAVTLAEGYSIRLNWNTNLRVGPSLIDGIFEIAPAGAILHVSGSRGRWLQIHRSGKELWLADWVGYSRVEAGPADIDNCCFVNRQCSSDQEWVDGYWAYQVNECPVGASARQEIARQPVSGTPAVVDNCCYLDWQCSSDQEWVNGYWAYQNRQCEHLGIAIEGSGDFVAEIQEALDLLQERAPGWYAYADAGLDKIKAVTEAYGTGVWVQHRTFNISPKHVEVGPIWLAGIIVHDACHVRQFEAGQIYYGLEAERACLEIQLDLLNIINPDDSFQFGLPVILANIGNPQYQWWH